jgi:hypothetical protein
VSAVGSGCASLVASCCGVLQLLVGSCEAVLLMQLVCEACVYMVARLSSTDRSVRGVMNNKLNLRTPSEVLPTCCTHETMVKSDPASLVLDLTVV